jgi:hypothetical protein
MTAISPTRGAGMLGDSCIKFLQSMYEETNRQVGEIQREARQKIWDEVNKWDVV